MTDPLIVLRPCVYTRTFDINSELKIATFLSTRTPVCRGGTGLKTVFLSVCGNLQHIGQNLRFSLKFFASLRLHSSYAFFIRAYTHVKVEFA